MKRMGLVVVLLFAVLSMLAGSAAGAAIWTPVYDSAGTSFSGWQTNHPDKFYWDSAASAYHFAITDAAEDYAFVPVAYPGGSFRLEFDVFPQATDWAGNFRLGLWDSKMAQETANSIYVHYHYDSNGHHIYLQAYPEAGSDGSARPSGYTDGQWYHNVVEYDAQAHTAMLTVSSDAGTFSGTATGLGTFGPMDRIAMTSIGDTAYPAATEVGYVRNVVLSVPGEIQAVFDAPKAGGRYWLRRSTLLPIQFRLVNAVGAPVTTSEEVTLEVQEVAAPTIRTSYNFAEALGNLRFRPSLSSPSYEATFQRATYALEGGGQCTAVAKVGGRPVGQVEFEIGAKRGWAWGWR